MGIKKSLLGGIGTERIHKCENSQATQMLMG